MTQTTGFTSAPRQQLYRRDVLSSRDKSASERNRQKAKLTDAPLASRLVHPIGVNASTREYAEHIYAILSKAKEPMFMSAVSDSAKRPAMAPKIGEVVRVYACFQRVGANCVALV
jgi:hypothetical protein